MTTRTPSKLIPADFAPTPSVDWIDAISVRAVGELDGDAGALGITGTPSYVIGNEAVFGAVGAETLEEKIGNVRSCGKTMC